MVSNRARTSDKKQTNKIRHTQTLTIKIVTIFPTTSSDCTFVNVFHILQTLSSWASFWSHGFFRKWIKTIKERKIINIMYYILSRIIPFSIGKLRSSLDSIDSDNLLTGEWRALILIARRVSPVSFYTKKVCLWLYHF